MRDGAHGVRALPWGAVDPGPSFGFATEIFADGVLEDVIGFFAFFLFGSQTVVKEIALPFNVLVGCQILFPVCDCSFYAGVAREGDDGMKVVGHQ